MIYQKKTERHSFCDHQLHRHDGSGSDPSMYDDCQIEWFETVVFCTSSDRVICWSECRSDSELIWQKHVLRTSARALKKIDTFFWQLYCIN